MFLELLRKEFIERKNEGEKGLAAKILSGFLQVLFAAALIALECFIFYSLDEKITKYSHYGTYDFLVLFLFAMFLVGVFFTMVKARNTLFDSKDSRVTMVLPLAPSNQVFAKVVYLYVEAALVELCTATPLWMTYGVRRHYIPYYHIFALLYPLIISFAIVGFALLFALVYQQIYRLIKKSAIAQFVTASVLVLGLCLLYQFILNLFLTALNDSSIGGVFSEDFISALHKARNFFLPVSFLTDALIAKEQIKSDIFFFLGATLFVDTLGVGVTSIVYYHEIKNETYPVDHKKHGKKPLSLVSPTKALIQKEISILFKDEANLFSYTSLLILCPFLTFAVISSLNSIIYDNLRFYAAYFPELVNGINLTLILLFSGVINASASRSMSRENKALLLVKMIPVSPLKQMLIKVSIPLLFSSVSFLLTEIILISAGIITLPVFFSSLFIGLVTLLFTDVFGVYADMFDLSSKKRKFKLSAVNEMIPLLLPLLCFLFFFLFQVVVRLPSYAIYLLASALPVVFCIPLCFLLPKGFQKSFYRMEVHN